MPDDPRLLREPRFVEGHRPQQGERSRAARGFFGSRASLRVRTHHLKGHDHATRGFFGSRASLRGRQSRPGPVAAMRPPRLLREPRFVEGARHRRGCTASRPRGFFGSRASLRAQRRLVMRPPPARTRGFFGSRASLRVRDLVLDLSLGEAPRLLREPRFVEGARPTLSRCLAGRPAASSGAALR